MGTLIETIEGCDYSRIDTRAFEHDGCIVDIGCATWDWSSIFLGKKRVIGADPFETSIPEGAELYKGVISSITGVTWINYNEWGTSLFNSDSNIFNSTTCTSMNWKTFCQEFKIDKVSILKMNIEGSEYPILHSMGASDFEKIDQIAVSFHNWLNPDWEYLTKMSINMLIELGYEVNCINWPYRWYLATKFKYQ